MNILFSPWSEYCIYQGEEDEWPRVPDLAVQFSPGNPVLCRGDLGICLAAWYWINFSKNSISRADHIMYLRKTRTESFFQKILWILLYAKLLCISGSCGPPCNSIHKKKALWQKFFIKTFLLQSSPTEPYLFTTEKSSQKYFSLQVSNSMRLTFRCNNASC